MNNLSRSVVVAINLALCALGVIATARQPSFGEMAASEFPAAIGLQTGYQFACGDLHKFSFAQLEAIVRADATTRFPNARVELGSVKAEHGVLTMTVVFFGPNHQTQAFLYGLVPEKNSWKIASAHRLWFVSPSQIARGLRV
jgi:hypothetical protein